MSVSPDEGDGAIETSGRAQLDLFWNDAVVVVAQTAPMVGKWGRRFCSLGMRDNLPSSDWLPGMGAG